MPNFQPNYIYSPLYGNRYLGGSRAHAPSTGSAGQVENTAVQRAATVGVPYVAPPEVSQGQPIGWSGTGRDQSAVSSLGNFGFVPKESLVQQGVMDTTDTYFDVPELDSTGSFQVPTTGESTIPSFSYGDESDNSVGTDYGQGILPDSSVGMDVAWGLYDLGTNAPVYAPGMKMFGELVGGAMLDSQIENISDSFDAMENVPEGLQTTSDTAGNVTYVYDPTSVASESNLDANEYAKFANDITSQGGTLIGLDASGNVVATKADGTTVRSQAGGSSINVNINDVVKDFSPQTTEQLDADSEDNTIPGFTEVEFGDEGDPAPEQDLSTTIPNVPDVPDIDSTYTSSSGNDGSDSNDNTDYSPVTDDEIASQQEVDDSPSYSPPEDIDSTYTSSSGNDGSDSGGGDSGGSSSSSSSNDASDNYGGGWDDGYWSEGGYIPASQSITQGMSMGNVTKFTQKDRYGNMLSIEFDVPKQMEIPHPGQPMGTDTVPAWLTPGERVMNAEAERMYGPILKQMNDQGRALQAAQGGTIPEYAASGCKVRYEYDGGPVYAQGGGRPDEWFYDPKMLDAIRQVESGGDPNAVSKAGAIGPYQILPSTALDPGYSEYGVKPISLEDAKDEKKAREFAMSYLAALQARNPDASPEQILQMYNAGEGRVRADIAGTGSKPLEKETIQYGDKVLAEFGTVPPINNISQAVPEIAEAGPQAMQETITSVPRLESVEDYAKYYNNQLLAGRGDRETYENALVDQFGISKGQAQALINSEYAGEGLVTGLKTPQEFIDDIESGNILGSDLARVGDPLPRKAVDLDLDDTFQVAPLSGIEVPPSIEQPPSPLTGLDNVFVEQPEDDRGQAYGDGLKIQLQAVEQQLANLQQEAKNPLKAPELIGSITELRNQRTRLADMYDEWAKTQGEKQALGYGTEDKVPSYTQEDVEVKSPVGPLEERRKRSLVTKEEPTKPKAPDPIDVATQESNKEKAITELEENTTTDPSETPSKTPDEVENDAKNATPEQKQEAKSFFDEWGLSELFNKKEIGKMMALYLGSRALGYSHNGSLNFAAKNYVKGIDRITKVADKLAVEGKHTKASIKKYRKSGDMTDLILKPVKPKRISAEPLTYFVEGASFNKGRVKLYEWEDQATKSRYLGDAAGNPIDMSTVHNEAFRVEGSPEYNKRIRASIDQIKPLFAEFDKNLNRGGDAGGDPLIAILPESATQQAARWAVVNDLDVTKLEGIVRGAYSDALAQKQRDPKTEISDIQPFLNQQVIRSYTGNPNLLQYKNDEGEFVPIDSAKLTVVNKAIANRIGTQWKDLRVDDLMNQYMASKEEEWVELGKNNPTLVDKYNNRANEGENGFLLFMLDDFGLLDKGRMK